MTPRCEVIGDCTLWLGNCRDVLPTLAYHDALTTDPPYGIGESAAKNRTRTACAVPTDYGEDAWDTAPATLEVFMAMARTRWHIIWGGNYYPLPPASCWLVWDKENTGDFADCELAWTNLPKASRLIRHMWNGMIRKGQEERFHLTQKPVAVMAWALSYLPAQASTLLDPFMGSGSLGVAAVQCGRCFTGIERVQKHFETACRRIEAAYHQPDLFLEHAKRHAPTQELLFAKEIPCL